MTEFEEYKRLALESIKADVYDPRYLYIRNSVQERVICWDLELMAPISNFGDQILQFEDHVMPFAQEFSKIKPHNILYLVENAAFRQYILRCNRAGLNGECLDWEEIKKLYNY